MCMFAEDIKIIKKDEESLKTSFDVLSTYEKASGSKINFEKTKGLYIRSARNRRPTFTKIKWVTGNVKHWVYIMDMTFKIISNGN